ncbi:conserved hypothetical protein [Culex quinquefasciatus]|uniref:Fibrinogen C-terminal domain-containing protein n=1 Tax=Culex quinquefasciatus TaxID=7176 RepID=B0X783_CULQU|nr:conserved hypothetical protein [Culex quinquefasciatus]|eukprot:XP_001865505.1 conserved hypothetical protein [Culex quinquefasciatus]
MAKGPESSPLQCCHNQRQRYEEQLKSSIISPGIQPSLAQESHLHLQINVIPIRVEMELTLGPNSAIATELTGDVPFLFCRSRQKRRLADRSAADSQAKSCRVPSDKKVDRAHGGKLVFGNESLEKAIIESHFPPCNSQLNWMAYRNGFGDVGGEFWLGLEKIYQLTKEGTWELIVELRDFHDNYKYARYSEFALGNEREKYALSELGTYSGTAGDYLKYHKGMKFSTFDNENDVDDSRHCAEEFHGAWCNLNTGTPNACPTYTDAQASKKRWNGNFNSLALGHNSTNRDDSCFQ